MRLRGGTTGSVSRTTVACGMVYLEQRKRTNHQKNPPSLVLVFICAVVAPGTPPDHAGGCLYPPRRCLVLTFVRASTGSSPKATYLCTSLAQFVPCISPVAHSASLALSATGNTTWTKCKGTRADGSIDNGAGGCTSKYCQLFLVLTIWLVGNRHVTVGNIDNRPYFTLLTGRKITVIWVISAVIWRIPR